jgi:DNA-binding transcriptional MerR regulator
MEDQLFTRAEVAAIFKVKPRTIWHWEAKNWIKPSGYVNTRPRYSLESIQKLGEEISTLKRIK